MIKKFSEFHAINEGAPNYDLEQKIYKTNSYSTFKREVDASVRKFLMDLEMEVEYDDGDTDDMRGVQLAIQSALDKHMY